jgi:methionine-rich copper-binding protein CopC
MLCLWVMKSGPSAHGRRVLIAAAALGLTLVGSAGAGVAAGSVTPIGFSPATGVVARAPMAVSVTFDQPLRADGAQVQVLTAKHEVGSGAVTTSHNTLRRQLQRGAPQGDYTIRWTAMLADGQPTSGEFTAARGNAEPVAPPEPTPTPSATPNPTPSATPNPTQTPPGTAEPTADPTESPAAAAPKPPTHRDMSSGFTIVPLTVGALLVLAAGLIARFNKPHLRA